MRRVYRGAFASQLLASSLSERNPQDRAFITTLVYGTLRHSIYLDACLKPHLKRPDKLPEDVRCALRAAAFELLIRETPRHAAVSEWVSVVKKKYGRMAGLVNAVLRKLEATNVTSATKYSLPNWLYEDWQTLFGSQAEGMASAMLEPEPFWLNVYHSQAKESLVTEGCEVEDGPIENTLAIRPSKPLIKLEAFNKGWVQAQNPSSVFVGRLLNAHKGDYVLDLASGSGIKAAQLASQGASVASVELSEKKLARAETNLRRLGLQTEGHLWDLRTVPTLEAAKKVLLDAPCSGTGTLRGHPEIKLRLEPADLDAVTDLQLELLSTAAALTAPGGTLIYAVCALTSAEGKDLVASFLEANQAFRADTFACPLPHKKTEVGSYLLPLAGLDGFFVSKLSRVN